MVEKKGIKSYTRFLLMAIVLTLVVYTFIQYPNIVNTITGKATTSETNVSVTFVGLSRAIVRVWNETLTGSLVDPSENGVATIVFNVTVSDADGASDINDSSVIALFNQSGTIRINNTACPANGESNTTSKNYTCVVSLYYFDNSSAWSINVTANDLGNKTYYNDSPKTFSYGTLKSFAIAPTFITFPSVAPGNTNVTSRQNTTLNNTGNVVINDLGVQINAIDLQGGTTTNKYLNASNFTASWNPILSMCVNTTAVVGGNGTLLINNTDVGVVGANLTIGNRSEVAGSGQEIVYYCIPKVPMIPSQSYITNTSGSWTVKIV